jgi:hypothetical protein
MVNMNRDRNRSRMKRVNAQLEARKAAKRLARWRLVLRFGPLVLLAATTIANLTLQYRLTKQKQEMKNLLSHQPPSWADFIRLEKSQAQEVAYIPAVNDSGVPIDMNINGEEWNIVEVAAFKDRDSRSMAETDCQHRTISYLQAANQVTLRANLWHEVFHAGGCLHGGDTYWNSINPTRSKHEGVKHLGDFMSNFSMANPAFMQWMGGR